MHNRTSKQRKSAQRRNAKFAALHAAVEKLEERVKDMKTSGTSIMAGKTAPLPRSRTIVPDRTPAVTRRNATRE